MAIVYIVQRPKIKCLNSGSYEDKYDISSARMFGELRELMPEGNWPKDQTRVMRMLREALQGYSQDDCILALGDPVAIAAACLVASRWSGGRITLLKFDRHRQCYNPHVLDPSN